MKILVTGANGFVGRNLVETLKNIMNEKDKTHELLIEDIYLYDTTNTIEELREYTKKCEFVINLAGVNRPKDPKEFYMGNYTFIETLCNFLKESMNKCPIIVSSSIQVGKDNDYAKSKEDGERYLTEFSELNGNPIYIYRFSNLFGKWCKPNYNSVIATWCHNITHNVKLEVSDPKVILPLCYIDDVVNELINCIEGNACFNGVYYEVKPVYNVSLGHIVNLLNQFKDSRNSLSLANQFDEFEKKLYATYLSYLDNEDFAYPLKMNFDERGSFTEFLKTREYGQISVNISNPQITKGNHWHHTKNEKFLVVSGKGIIRFRKIGDDQIFEYKVSSENLKVVDIPVGYTHNIENIGDVDMVTIMWANEAFDLKKPDTYFEEV